MIDKFLNYIKHSYHRPTAKIEHFCVLISKIFLNKKTKLISEKLMLLKFPPSSMLYFNSIGRFFYALVNFLSIIVFRNFFDKSLSIETFEPQQKEKKDIKLGNDLSPWPPQAIHLFEKNEKISDDFFDKIYTSYKKAIDNNEDEIKLQDSPWWSELRKEFQEIFLKKDGVNKNAIINFRNDVNSRSAILKDQNIALSKKKYKAY